MIKYLGITILLALLFLGLISPMARAQGCDPYVIQGKVFFEGQPAQDITVSVYYEAQETTFKAISDENGIYAILIPIWIEGDSYRITALYRGQSFEAYNRFIKYQEGGKLRQGDDINIILGTKPAESYNQVVYIMVFSGLLMLLTVWFIYKDQESRGLNEREK